MTLGVVSLLSRSVLAGLTPLPPCLAGKIERPSRLSGRPKPFDFVCPLDLLVACTIYIGEDMTLVWETAASLGFDNNQKTGYMILLSTKETVTCRRNARI